VPLLMELVETPTDDARTLVEELEEELSRSYAAEQRHGYDLARIFQPNVRFFLARLDGEAVGCGGVAFEEGGLAEIKRMYVRPRERGRRIGCAILARLEEEARGRHVARLVLETGDVLHAAHRLYRAAGFTPCGPFGAFASMPPASIARSVFMEKRLGDRAAALGEATMLAVDHFQLAIPPGGEPAARRFFVGVLGMAEEQKPAPLASRGGCWFRAGGVHLHCGVESPFQPQRKAHPAFLVNDLDALADALASAGVTLRWDESVPDRRRFYADDPFGNRQEFMAAADDFSRRLQPLVSQTNEAAG
jgi:GNAT superfamily N-acetyltransferase